MYCITFTRILVILMNHGLTSQFRHTHNTVSPVHTILLYRVNSRIHLTTTTVKIGSMHVDAKRLSTYLLGMDTGRISQPIVCMNDIKVKGTCHNTCDNGVVVNLLMQVSWITSSKLHGTEIIHMHVVEVRIDMVTQLEIEIRIHDVTYTVTDIVITDITPCYRHGIHGNDVTSVTLFITKRFRQAERDIHITLGMKSLRDTIVSGGESTEHVRRILPSKH